jgi:hypothetical protein
LPRRPRCWRSWDCLPAARPGAAKQFPLEAAFINHAVGGLFDGTILGIVHPGFSLGTEYAYLRGRYGRLYQNVQAGYYHNKYNARALFFLTSGGYRYTLGWGVFGEAFLGLGYLRSFHPVEIWRLNSAGEYERARDTGKGAAMISAGLGLGYDFSRKLNWPVSLFVRYQYYAQTPYSADEGALGQAWIQAGIRVQVW